MKNKNKISIKQVKGLQKTSLQHFFFFFFFLFWLFIFVLLLFGPILKYKKNKSAKGSYELIIQPCFCHVSSVRKHFSLDAANFSLFSQEGEITSPLISGPVWTLRLQFTKYQQSYAPMKIFLFFFFVIPHTVYIRSTELYRSQFMCYILLLATGV